DPATARARAINCKLEEDPASDYGRHGLDAAVAPARLRAHVGLSPAAEDRAVLDQVGEPVEMRALVDAPAEGIEVEATRPRIHEGSIRVRRQEVAPRERLVEARIAERQQIGVERHREVDHETVPDDADGAEDGLRTEGSERTQSRGLGH